jgi:hypothetical protein
MARYNPDDHGPPDSMGGLHDAAEAIRSAGRGGDTILAHINPREAALLKAHGGSGAINPNTGLPEFDDGDWGYSFMDFSPPSYSYSYDPTPSYDYYSSNLGGMTGGYDPYASTYTGMTGTDSVINNIYNNYISDLYSNLFNPVQNFTSSLESNLQSILPSIPSASDVLSYLTPNLEPYVDPTKLVQQPQFVQQPAFGSDQQNVGATVQSDADRAAATGVGQDLTAPTGTIYYTVPSPTGGATLGVGAQDVAEGLAGLGGQYGTVPGPESVAPSDGTLTVLTPEQTAALLALPTPTGSQPPVVPTAPDLAAQMAEINRQLDYSGGTVIGKQTEEDKLAAAGKEIGAQVGEALAGEQPADLTTKYVQTVPITPPDGTPQPNVTLGYTAPSTGVQVGGSQNLVGQFTVGGPEGYSGGAIDPYGDYTPVGPNDLGNPIEVASLGTFNIAPAAKGSGSLDPNLFTTQGMPDVAAQTLAQQSDALTSLNQQLANQLATQPSTAAVTPAVDPLTGAVDTTPVTTAAADVTPVPVTPRPPATMRTYLGAATDPYTYGFGAERAYYAPAAARGGYFDADQYFANGGLVSPLQPPSQPTVPPYPTMAFTDGGGPVGSIAQPPGLVASDAYGSDAPHASPMAPSVAASVPTMQPGLSTLAMRNVNASPAPSPISQNPNVGYALGQSPLSNL